MIEYLRMDLQLFADGLIGDGEEEDTVEEEIDGDIEDDEDTDLQALLDAVDEEEEDKEDDEEDDEEEVEEDKPPANGKFYTQDELDALISSRVQREQAKFANLDVQSVRKLEKAAGMPISDILEQVKNNRVQSYVDNGMDEDLAARQVEQDLTFEELQERVQRSEGYIQNMTRSVNYEREKNAVINKNPLYKKFESEIDAFSAYGSNLGFEDAAKYIIGEKIANDSSLLDDIRRGAANKALAKKSKTPESGSQPGGKVKGQLTSYERNAAKALGISEKEWLQSKKQLNKRSKR